MANVIIEKPVLNSPYSEPMRHFKFDDEAGSRLLCLPMPFCRERRQII
jgi:hypothetical protein